MNKISSGGMILCASDKVHYGLSARALDVDRGPAVRARPPCVRDHKGGVEDASHLRPTTGRGSAETEYEAKLSFEVAINVYNADRYGS